MPWSQLQLEVYEGAVVIYFFDGGSGTPSGVAGVVLLLGGEGADASTSFTDESPSAHTLTANGNVQVDTAQFKYGSASILFDGTGDYIQAADSTDWFLESGDFTIEMFFRPASIGTRQLLCGQANNTASTYRNIIEITAAGKIRYLSLSSSAVLTGPTGATTLSINTWYHIAFARQGNAYRLFLDGVLDGSGTSSNLFTDLASPFCIGRAGDFNSLYAHGHMDELRITKGTARYTANFTPPAAAFPRV
jgi:hypothetical protein